MTDAILSCVSSVTHIIDNDRVEPLDRKLLLRKLSSAVKLSAALFHGLSESRKAFITPGFEKSFRSALEKTSADEFLFGNKLQDLISGTETLVKVSKQIRTHKEKKQPLKPANRGLNWKDSDEKVERTSRKRTQSPHTSTAKKRRSNTSRAYTQSQPIQSQGRQTSRGGSRHQ